MNQLTSTKDISDLTLGTYLRHRGHKFLGIERDGNRSVFRFARTPALEADILAYFNGEGRVEPLSFVELLRNLKAAAIAQVDGRGSR